MSYTLAAAASATGMDRATILAAIRDGKVAATRDQHGEWHIEPAELHALYPPVAMRESDAVQQFSAPEIEAMATQIEALLRKAADRLRRQLDDVRRDHGSGDDETQAEELLLADREEQLP